MTNGTKVKKRNGSIEPLNLEKMHVMVEEACKNLAGVSASQVDNQEYSSMTVLAQERYKKFSLSLRVT